jgi:catechol 2,3-dioxygenase-like lactoylglutathione lyase family enzyme
MEPRITLITLGVADLPRAVRFYRDGLGWPAIQRPRLIAIVRKFPPTILLFHSVRLSCSYGAQ